MTTLPFVFHQQSPPKAVIVGEKPHPGSIQTIAGVL
jgi:hypothetical protein